MGERMSSRDDGRGRGGTEAAPEPAGAPGRLIDHAQRN